MLAATINVRHALLRPMLLAAAFAALLTVTEHTSAAVSCETRAARAQQVLVGAELDNWEPLSDREVLVWTAHARRANLVRLAKPLAGLSDAPIVELVDGDHDGSISPCGHDGLRLGGGTGSGQTVRIVSIQLLSERRTAELDPGEHVTPMEFARA